MRRESFLQSRLRAFLGMLVLSIAACQFLGDDGDNTFSFDSQYETLKAYDRVDISISDTSGADRRLIFSKKVDSPDQLRRIPAPGYAGGPILITIHGHKDGQLVSTVEKTYDGRTKQTLKTLNLKDPRSDVTSDIEGLNILEGDSAAFPAVIVKPDDLAVKEVTWSVSEGGLLALGKGHVLGISRGTAWLTATLVSDTARKTAFRVDVGDNPALPDSLTLSPDTLEVAVDGATGRFKVEAHPAGSSAAVDWSWQPSDRARIVSLTASGGSGLATGLNPGLVRVRAQSQKRPSVADSAWLKVVEAVPAKGIRFLKDSIDLFVGGSPESLRVQVDPPLARQEASFEVSGTGIVKVDSGKAYPMAEGEIRVTARAAADGSLTAVLRVRVHPRQKVDSVVINPSAWRLYTRGDAYILQAKVHGQAVSPRVRWRSSHAETVSVDSTGRIVPGAPGTARIVATSVADSSKSDSIEVSVRRDVPRVDAGRDTAVPPGRLVEFNPTVTQDHGVIEVFKWDLDGDGTWEGEAVSTRPVSFRYDRIGEYDATFFYRDSEGNDTTAVRKVNVSDSPLQLFIVHPGRDTVVKDRVFTVRYTVNEVPLSKDVTLKHGLNVVRLDTMNTKGASRDSVAITLDTVPPVVKIHSPSPDQPFRTRSITVEWTVDDLPQDSMKTGTLGAADGPYTIARAASDAAGNVGTASVRVFLDTRPPTVTIGSPQDGFNTRDSVVRVTWFIESERQSRDTVQSLKPGANRLVRYAQDAAGNRDSAVVTVNYFDRPPVVRIISPLPGSFTAKARIPVIWTVNEVVQARDTVEDLDEGPNLITRKATDVAGNEGSVTLTVTLNTRLPDVQITSPLPGSATSQSIIQVAWTVNGVERPVSPETLKVEGENTVTRSFRDSLGLEGSNSVKVFRDQGSPAAPKVSVLAALLTNQNPSVPAQWTWRSQGDNAGGAGMPAPRVFRVLRPGVPDVTLSDSVFTIPNPGEGVHSLRVQEQDRAGNWSTPSAAADILVDRTAPNPPLVTGVSPSSSPSWTWASNGSGGAGVFRYRLDNGPWSAETAERRYHPHTVTDEDHTLHVQERDENGSWSADGSLKIAMDRAEPSTAGTSTLACMSEGSATDTVVSGMDSEGFRAIFDGKTFTGWWQSCLSSHRGPARFGIDTAAKALYGTQSGTMGGLLLTNKLYRNYEIVFDFRADFGNDAGVLNRSTSHGMNLQTSLDYIPGAGIGGIWGDGGLMQRDFRPFSFSGNAESIQIPGNNQGDKSNWTKITSGLDPTSFGCSPGGCVQADWRNLWSRTGWNQLRIQFFGNVVMNSYFRKFGSQTWVPLLKDSFTQTLADGAIGIQVSSGNRHPGVAWYRNIKVRELDDSGNPVNP